MKTKFTLAVLVLFMACTCVRAQNQWVRVSASSNKSLYGFAYSGNNAVIAGTGGAILYSADAGLTWTDTLVPSYQSNYSVIYRSATDVLMGSSGSTLTSSNSGKDFGSRASVSSFGDLRDMTRTSGNNMIAVSEVCRVATSTDNGQTWTSLGNKCNGNLNELRDIDFPSANTGYFCGGNATFYKTINAGQDWTPVTIPVSLNKQFYAVQFFTDDIGFIAGGSGSSDTSVFSKTTDGGLNWVNMKPALLDAGLVSNAGIRDFAFLDANKGLLLASNNVVFSTVNGGTTWYRDTLINSTDNGTATQVYISPTYGIVMTSQGKVWRTGLGGSTRINETTRIQTLEVFPNPAGNYITLGSQLVQQQAAFVSVYNAQGQLVKAEKLDTNEMGIAGLNSGIYFGNVTTGTGERYTFKFIKQ